MCIKWKVKSVLLSRVECLYCVYVVCKYSIIDCSEYCKIVDVTIRKKFNHIWKTTVAAIKEDCKEDPIFG